MLSPLQTGGNSALCAHLLSRGGTVSPLTDGGVEQLGVPAFQLGGAQFCFQGSFLSILVFRWIFHLISPYFAHVTSLHHGCDHVDLSVRHIYCLFVK